MCIIVYRSPNPREPWNADLGVITIPAGLSVGRQVLAVRAVLLELGIPQPANEAVCWCGAPVESYRVPAQRRNEGACVAS